MGKVYEIKENGLVLQSGVPFLSLLWVETEIMENEHGKGIAEGVIAEEGSETVMETDFTGDDIAILDGEGRTVFAGLVETAEFAMENGVVTGKIGFTTYSILLDREKKSRSFQNTEISYKKIAGETAGNYQNGVFSWNAGQDRAIQAPIIQYKETDWEFMKRLASHFHKVLYPGYAVRGTSFYFGGRKGREIGEIAEGVKKQGISSIYYSEGGPEEGWAKNGASYIEAEGGSAWEIGDIGVYRGMSYTVCRKSLRFSRGEAVYTYLFGGPYFTYRKRRENRNLKGARLKGMIQKTEKESVYLHLEMDKEWKGGYAWDWAPEIGNVCYCMPETGTKAVLYFPSGEEKDGIALHALRKNRKNTVYGNVQDKELCTRQGKRVGLYPDKVCLEARGGSGMIDMEDGIGIYMASMGSIRFAAALGISIKGKQYKAEAPLEVVYKAGQSNIELCRDINIYAPGGVYSNGSEGRAASAEPEQESKGSENPDHWQMSYAAMAAVPSADLSDDDDDDGKMMEILAQSAVPKIAGGREVLVMEEVMEGTPCAETSCPRALQSMELFTVKGGHGV